MTMDTHQHPDDERLAALAGGEPDALGDDRLRGHVAGCSPCREVLDDLTKLRAALAALPDLAPQRPLELRLPEPRRLLAERLAAFSQRAFVPVMGLASALLLVGVIGTGVDVVGSMASRPAAEPAPAGAPEEDAGDFTTSDEDGSVPGAAGEPEDAPLQVTEDAERVARVAAEGTQAVAQSWPWNALLVIGVALMILALVVRFAVRPRAGT
jgi:hypothetical protein